MSQHTKTARKSKSVRIELRKTRSEARGTKTISRGPQQRGDHMKAAEVTRKGAEKTFALLGRLT